jgi:hypothetical protein
MFIALMIKEWREKALIFLFELAVLVGLLGAQYVVRENRDLREWFVYAVLLLFFPFAALILGTAGFESEYRQGAWTYLFSRPVSRVAVWLAKFAALLGLFAILWLFFVAAWAALPAIREMAAGPRIFLEALGANGFPWWSLGLSFFMFIVAFSLSFLHERYFNLLFLSVILGLALPALAWSFFVRDSWFFIWVESEKMSRTLLIGLILMAAAFIGASLLTLVRADFAQPRRRIWSYARWLVLFLLAGQALTVATALWLPVPEENFLGYMNSTGQAAFYYTEHGLFAYDVPSGTIRWLEKTRHPQYYLDSISSSRFAYVRFEYLARNNVREEVWVCDSDGTGRARVLGRDTASPWPKDPSIRDLIISPDGQRIAVLTDETRWLSKTRYTESHSLWAVNADGSGLEKLPLDALIADGAPEPMDLSLTAWGRETNILVLAKRFRHVAKPLSMSLWLYDLNRRTLKKVQDDAGQASWTVPVSPRRDLLAIRYPYGDPKAPRTLALLDLKTQQKLDIVTEANSVIYGIQWDPTGNLFSYVLKKPDQGGASSFIMAVYSLSEEKIISEKALASSEASLAYFSAAWMPDGRSLIAANRENRNLLFFGTDLHESGRIPLPARLKEPWGISVISRQVLIVDGKTDALWRLDLDTKRWKRLY